MSMFRPVVKIAMLLASVTLFGCGAGNPASTASAGSSLNADGNTTGGGTSTASGNTGGTLLQPSYCAVQYPVAVTDDVAQAQVHAALPGTDPLLFKQWHLQNTGQSAGTIGEDLNVLPAWARSQGVGVRVAVIDNSLETVHPDLSANVVSKGSYDYRSATRGNNDPLPCTLGDTHGTSVAGIIAAKADNAIGGSGVAPQARLVGFNALATNTDADLADALLRDVDKNAVYNSSWGSQDDAKLHPVTSLHALALDRGVRIGRNGLGAIYVFAAGNGGCYRPSGESACQPDSTNYDGYLNHLAVIAVGALDRNGKAPAYAEPGANLLITAPGGDSAIGVTTTAIRGSYVSNFAGSSAAAPMVAGVSALMLAANPALSWRDVRLLLARTARRVDSTHVGWSVQNGSQAPYAFNPVYGFGAVNADAAVAAAVSWQTLGGSERLITCGPYVRELNESIVDAGAALRSDVTVDAAGCAIGHIEYVELEFTASHEYSGDLQIQLTSPSGAVSELARPRRCGAALRNTNDCGVYEAWRFGSVRHLDEAASGTWQLSVSDKVAGKTGQMGRWSLRIYGR